MVSILVAFAGNGVIGRDGALPWHLPTDMKRFRELTSEHAVVMGRRTFESLPDRFRPLPNRRNLVLSSNCDWRAPGAEVFPDLSSAIDACDGDCFVIGGEQAYREALSIAERVYATEVEGEIDGDAFFPALAESEWRRVQQSERVVENEHGFTFCVYERALEPAV
ncbi:MAG: dihydrofolate reductase [Solirubrobacteraceae bacterium]|jgi:dihydrofolate reductase